MNGVSVEVVTASVAAITYSVWPYRSTAALTLAFANLAHFYLFETIDSDVMFYVSACTFDVACALLLMAQRNRLALDVATLSLFSAMANIAGLFMWFAYFPASIYNAAIQIVLGLQILRLLWVRADDMAGDTWLHRWGGVVRGHRLWGVGKAEGAEN